MEVLTKAANILDISEFEVLSRAYAHWHGSNAPSGILQVTFSKYLKTQELPHWAKHYALQIIQAFEAELQREGEFLKLVYLVLFGAYTRVNKGHHLIAQARKIALVKRQPDTVVQIGEYPHTKHPLKTTDCVRT